MLVSLVIPAYNCAGTIYSTVESVIKSGLEDYELILVDDGSTDETAQLCDTLSAKYTNARCIHQNNTGVSGARNRGIREAEGEFILFFDSDDTVDPGAFSGIREILQKEKPDMLLFGMSFDYYSGGKLYRRDPMVCDRTGSFEKEQWMPMVDSLYRCNYLSPVWNKFIRRDLILESDLRFSETMHLMEDCLFTLQCLEHCERIYLLPKALYRYRQPEDEGNAARRLRRISSLVEYMEHFSILPDEWRQLANSIYYMLLHLKVRASDVKEIAAIARDHKRGAFSPQTEQDQWLSEQLSGGKYISIFLRSLKSRARHKVAVFAKSHGLYSH